ncbi:ankyrin repeat, PH and SEC7 domain containing protein secG-like [Lolium rigidum]|uniref:ankyrin repeat, PH and SEC7 domain containing protein secG-like n=1 Tax=Lolium rigidum TaxID=89674 RepID=UPI001F5CFFEE|nr:ankyrin repeat, PH and SEC7 domain containing protein secG-like [Lolium rigidum]
MASSASDIALKAAFDGNLRLLKKMAKKVDLRGAKDAKGDTVLHFAARKGCLQIYRFLVEESGLDVNTLSKTGATPMDYAAFAGNVQVMRYLIDHGADPAIADQRGTTPLHSAAEEGHCEAVRLLLSKGVPVDPVDHQGAPLHLAIAKDRPEVVKLLLEHGADPNKVVNQILSPLVMSVFGKSLRCMKILIEAGADLNARGKSGPTPLTQAVDDGFTDFIKLLLEAGADPNIPSEHGAIPVEIAAVHGRRDLVEVLFSKTKPVPSLPDWSVDGIIRTVNSPDIPLQAAVSVEEKITYWKSQGKEAFAKEDYFTAMSFYGKVLDVNPSDATMYANQSLCWLRMRHGELALEDARKCRTMRPCWSKAWYREGAALSFMKDYEGAADAFQVALQLDPKSQEIREALRNAEKAAEEPQSL